MARRLPRAESPETFREAPLLEHLEELRLRIIYAIGFWLVGSSVAYFFRDAITAALQRPLGGLVGAGRVRFVTTTVTEPLIASFQIALFGGLVVALPFIVYQLWAFVAPGLTSQERRWGGPFILGMGFSFAAGVAFAYSVILPYALPFMLNFLGGVENLLSYGRYVNDMTTYLGAFGLLFELPITLFLLTKVGLVNARMLAAGRRVAVMVIVVASAIITPTADPINLALMAVPLYVLYEVGILLSAIGGRQNRAASGDI
jgi:sec-independent protein translocase protein TatC